jgi:hypothetical protein
MWGSSFYDLAKKAQELQEEAARNLSVRTIDDTISKQEIQESPSFSY